MAKPTYTKSFFPPNFFGRKWHPTDPEQNNNAGAAFFGIDAKYLLQIQKREIGDLVTEGKWNSETLYRMTIEERRFYYHQLIERLSPKDKNNGPPSPGELQKKSQKK